MASMAKSDLKKRAELMAKEWKKSRSSTRSLNNLVGMGLLHNQELSGWRAPEGKSNPNPRAGEIVVFEDFFKRGFGIPVPYSLEVVLVPRLLAGSDEIVDKRLAQFFPRVKRVLGQAEEPLMASLVEDNWEVICHDVLVSYC